MPNPKEELIFLDVGHGNCTIVCSNRKTSIIDTPKKGYLLESLKYKDIDYLDYIIISHVDEDHVGGLLNILSSKDISIGEIYINPDPIKKSGLWGDVRCALEDACDRGCVHLIPTLSNAYPGEISLGPSCTMNILHPRPLEAMSAVGGQDRFGRSISHNSQSAVVEICYNGKSVAVVAGDIEGSSLEIIKGNWEKRPTQILVFPHHGGRPGQTDPQHFAQECIQIFEPEMVYFSNGRKVYDNPRAEIVDTIKQKSGTYIGCSQLSKGCSDSLPKELGWLEGSVPSAGYNEGISCLGTVVFDLAFGLEEAFSFFGGHAEFVNNFVDTPKCNRN